MTPERWQRVKTLFEGALTERAADRDEYLAVQCADDPALRSEVESLLASDARAMTVLDHGAAPALGSLIQQEGDLAARGLVGRRLGHYRITEEIGRGGMAIVYAAVRDDRQYEQRVAIKLIRRGMDTEPLVARFRQERQILANLDHPNIARLVDGGVTTDGLPYLVMEAIEGEPIDAYANRNELSTAQRLDLFRTVCAAVHYAHQNLVVHRDLKPSNILVTGDGVPKLLDFGIAKLLEPTDVTDAENVADPTIGGPRPMTPEYASPEQLRGDLITTASDVYALGVLLYRLLTGHRPFQFATATHAEISRVVCHQTPERPSTVIDLPTLDASGAPDLVAGRGESRVLLRRQLRGDLDNIVLMALEKEPQRRYASAAAFADDIRRHLAGETVTARRDTTWYRASRFVRRHWLGVAAVATVLVSLVAGITATTWQARVASTQRANAEVQRANAEVVADFMVGLFELWYDAPDLGLALTASEVLERGVERLERDRAEQLERDKRMKPLLRATLLDRIGIAFLKLGLYDRAEPLVDEAFSLRDALLPDDDLALATSRQTVGELLLEQGQLTEATALFRKALAARRAGLGPRDQLVAETENKLGLALRRQGDLAEAESLLLSAVAWQRDALGPANKEVAQGLTMLALVLKDRGDRAQAESLFRQALEVTIARFGPSHSLVAVGLNNVAGELRAQGLCEDAQLLYEQALEIERANLPPGHPELATTLHNLAGCLKDLSAFEQAERLYQEALDIRTTVFGPEHLEVAGVLNNFAELAADRGQWGEAEAFLRRALAIYGLQGDRTTLAVGGTCFNLAEAIRVQRGDLAEAEGLAARAVEIHREVLGPRHATLEKRLFVLTRIQMDRGRFAAAKEHLSERLFLLQRDLGEDTKPVAVARIELARALAAVGDPAAAAVALRAALATLTRLDGDESRAIAVARNGLASALITLGEPDQAKVLLEASDPVLRARYGVDHPRVATSFARWVALFESQGLARPEAERRATKATRRGADPQ